jgi:hypothetical protein
VTAPVLFLLLVLSTASTGGLYRALERARHHRVSDGAAILAFEGVRAFAEGADVMGLMQLPVGADSLIMTARVFDGAGSTGTYAVRIAHIAPAAFALRSTGRLIAEGRSIICSVDVRLRFDGTTEERARVGVETEPLCNGLRHRSAVTSARTIGS